MAIIIQTTAKGAFFTIKRKFAIGLILLSFNVFSADYYVSSSGSDNNNGLSSASPWKTISKVNTINFQPGDKILFKRGEIFTGSIIVKQSGSLSSPITYGAYGTGVNPIISGLQTISGWTSMGNGIFRAPVSTSKDVNLLLINNELKNVGRFPNTGYLSYENSTSSTITDNQLASSPNWTNAEVVIKMNGWTITRNPVVSHSGNTISFINKSPNNYIPRLGSTYGYFLQRDLKTLDQFGEWHYDGSNMYVYFGSQNPTNYTVKTSNIDNLFYLNSKSHIILDGLNFTGSNQHSIYAWVPSGSLKIKNCNIEFSGTNGIFIGGYANSVLIDNNNITETQGYALVVGRSGTATGIIVSNNTIINSGLQEGMGGTESSYGAVYVKGSNSIIEYNIIKNSGYNGISFFENGSIVRYNLIDDFNSLIHDGGAVYTWKYTSGFSSGMKVHNNIILNGTDGNGVYSDGLSDNLEIFNNTIANLKAGFGIIMNQPRNNYVHNNITYNNYEPHIGVHNLVTEVKASGNTITQNQVISTSTYPDMIYIWDDYNTDVYNFGILNNNYYIAPTNVPKTFDTRSNNPWKATSYSFTEWKNFGFDKDSKITYSNDLLFDYNATKVNKTITLPYPMMDAKGTKYYSTVTIPPYSSVVLCKDPNPSITNNTPVINAQSFSVGAIAPGGFIGKVTATDPDAGQTLTYAITAGTKSSLFYIAPTTGNIYTVQSYAGSDLSGTITVQVTDNGNPLQSASATITINQTSTTQNNPPVISNRTFTIGTIGTFKFIGNVTATDPDAGQILSYKIISGNSAGKFFVNSMGHLYTSSTYNGIDNLSGSLTVEVTDDGTPKLSSTATITIVHNTNNAPVINAQSFSVGAIAPGGFVGQVTATDPDAGQSLTYAISTGTKSDLFYIAPTTGNLYTVQSYAGSDLSGTITVQVTDNGNPLQSASATITITQTIGNNPPAISNKTFTIGAIGTFKFIGNVTATDPDAGQKLSYKIISGNSAGKFFVNSLGHLYTSSTYNGIDNLSGSLTVEVTDDGTPKLSSTATITIVHNTNNAPVINAQSFSIGAIAPGGFIGQVTATDPDAGQSLTYAITAGTKSDLFYIAPTTGNLYTVQSYAGSDLSGTITVQVTDNGNPLQSASATITITQTIGNNPPAISNKTFTIGAIGTFKFIGNVTATDPDAGQKLSYKIISGNSAGKFFVNSMGHLYTSSSYNGIDNLTGSLTVEVTDDGTPKLSSTATITIVHNTNNAPVINAQSFTVGSVAPGGFIGKIIATDPDAGQSLTFRIASGDVNNRFWIAPSSGNLYTLTTYLPDSDLNATLDIEVSDNGVPQRISTAQIVISHTLSNTAPSINNQTFNINGTIASGAYIGKVLASDVDLDQTLQYRIVGGVNYNQFWIAPSSGNLYTVTGYNSTTNLTTTITVEVTDNGNPAKSSSALLTINHSLAASKSGLMSLDNISNENSENELMVERSVVLYPNPAINEINLQIKGTFEEPATLRIIDMGGRTIFNARYATFDNTINEQLKSIRMESGIYILQIKSGDFTHTERFTKL